VIRWSELEARKPYASPFGVRFVDDSGADTGSVAVNGADLVYYRQFQHAVLRLGGELFVHAAVERDTDPEGAWLDVLQPKLGEFTPTAIEPRTYFDERVGDRRFQFVVHSQQGAECSVDSSALTEYQELQAAVAHLTGRLIRDRSIETVEDGEQRRRAWIAAVAELLRRPGNDDAMTEIWPWR